jgi:hypothetical protein
VKLLAVALLFLAGSTPKASLKVTYWPHGRGAAAIVWTLQCGPAAGTHPMPRRTCTTLHDHVALLGPALTACTLLARRDAPTAQLTGTYAGRKIDRSFRIGCPGWTDLRIVLTGS